MLTETMIANASLTINSLPSIASIDIESDIKRPSKSQILITQLWGVEFNRTCSFIDWAFLSFLFKPLEIPVDYDIGFSKKYSLEQEYSVAKILGFNDRDRVIPYLKIGSNIYTNDKISVIWAKKSIKYLIPISAPDSFRELLTAHLSLAISISLKGKISPMLRELLDKSLHRASVDEGANHSPQKVFEATYSPRRRR